MLSTHTHTPSSCRHRTRARQTVTIKTNYCRGRFGSIEECRGGAQIYAGRGTRVECSLTSKRPREPEYRSVLDTCRMRVKQQVSLYVILTPPSSAPWYIIIYYVYIYQSLKYYYYYTTVKSTYVYIKWARI